MFGGALVALTIAEMGIRAVIVGNTNQWRVLWSPVVRPIGPEGPDPILNHVLKPSSPIIATSYPAGLEFCVFGETSSQGLNDDVVPTVKAGNEIRIAVLGDSFVEARQVRREANFCEVLEQRLTREAGRTVRVINAGVSSYSPILEYLLYTRRIRAFRPDIVVQMFFANDVFDDVRYSGRPGQPGAAQFDPSGRPVAVPAITQWIALPTLSPEQAKAEVEYLEMVAALARKKDRGGLIAVSYLADYIDTAWQLRTMRKRFPQRPRSAQFFILEADPTLSDLQHSSWRLTARYITFLYQAVAADGAKFILTSAPIAAQIDPRNTIEDYLIRGQPTLEDQAQLKLIAEGLGIEFIDMVEPLRAAGDGLYFPRDGHWTEKGHAVIADVLFKKVLPLVRDQASMVKSAETLWP